MGKNGYASVPTYSSKLYGGSVFNFVRSGFEDFSFSFNTFYMALLFNSITLCRLPPTSTLEILVPADAVGKVMGKGGANIGNMRKVGLTSYKDFLIFSKTYLNQDKQI